MNNSINTKLKEAHNNYYRRSLNNSFGGNCRQFWGYTIVKHQDKHDISTLFTNNIPINSATGKANALNCHFKSAFTHENLLTMPTMDHHTDVPTNLNIPVTYSA